MVKRRVVIAIVCSSLQLAGCATQTYQREQSNLRDAIVELYQEQLRDNLARAYEGQPLIHVAYTQLTGKVTVSARGEAGFTETNPADSGLETVWRFLGVASKENQIQVVSVPVTNNQSVYDAYRKFAENKSRFCSSTDPGCPGDRIPHDTWARGGKQYFAFDKKAYLDLIIQTTVSAQTIEVGKTLTAEVESVKDVTGQPAHPVVKNKLQHFLLLTFDQNLPNSAGQLSVTNKDGARRVFNIEPVRPPEGGKPDIEKRTFQLVLFYSEKSLNEGHDIPVDEMRELLIGRTVTLALQELKGQRIAVDSLDPATTILREQLQQQRAGSLN